MTDIYTILVLGAFFIALAIIIFLVRKRRLSRLNKTQSAPEIPIPRSDYSSHRVGFYRGYNPGLSIVETNSGFSEGLIIGNAMSEPQPETVIVTDTVITGNYINPPTFTGYSGGDSDGGGAPAQDYSCSSDPDSTSDSESCDSDSSSGDS